MKGPGRSGVYPTFLIRCVRLCELLDDADSLGAAGVRAGTAAPAAALDHSLFAPTLPGDFVPAPAWVPASSTCAAASMLPCSCARAAAPNATRDTRGGCLCCEGVPPAAAGSESSLSSAQSSALDQPAFVSRSDAAPSVVSWSAQNEPAKQGRPVIAAAYTACGVRARPRGVASAVKARARAHSENNSVFPYVFSGPEADFGRWPRDPRGGSRGGIAGWAAAIGPQRPRESDRSARGGLRVQTAEPPA